MGDLRDGAWLVAVVLIEGGLALLIEDRFSAVAEIVVLVLLVLLCGCEDLILLDLVGPVPAGLGDCGNRVVLERFKAGSTAESLEAEVGADALLLATVDTGSDICGMSLLSREAFRA